VFRVESRKFFCQLHHLQSHYKTLCFLPPVRLTLTLTPRVLGTSCCVLLLQVLCRIKKLFSGVKRALSSGLSSRGSGSRFGNNGLQDSLWSSSFVPSPLRTTGSSHYLAHDGVPEATNDDDISIRTTEEREKYEFVHRREFAHTHIYDVKLLERVGLDEELPIILQTIGWEKLYNKPHQGSRLLTLEFLSTFKIVEKHRKLFAKFHLLGKSFGCDFSCFSELLDFSKSCFESSAMRNFNKVEFSDAISGKSARLRFSDIHNPSLRFLHRWMSFMVFPMAELRFVTTPELKCLFAMVNMIKYTPVSDIVDYFTNVSKISGPIECISLVTRIAMNLGCSDFAYIKGDVPVLRLDHFVHVHILRREPDYSVSMMYCRKAIRLPNPALRLNSCESLTLQFDQMGELCHSFRGLPRTHRQAHLEVAQQTMTTPQAHPQEPQWDTRHGGGYSGNHESGSYYTSHGYPEPSLQARTSISARYPDCYAPLERYVRCGVNQAERMVEGIG
jgi:hypothetical protein